jgi:hypothetical protein
VPHPPKAHLLAFKPARDHLRVERLALGEVAAEVDGRIAAVYLFFDKLP